MTSDDSNEDKREIIKVKASTYTNYPTKNPDEITLSTEIGNTVNRSTKESIQFRFQDERTKNKEFTQRRLEADALEALKGEKKERKKIRTKRKSSPS